MGGKESDLSQIVEDNTTDAELALYFDSYSNVSVTSGNQTGRNVNRMAIIREFLKDVGLSESKLLAALSEMRGNLRGRLEL